MLKNLRPLPKNKAGAPQGKPATCANTKSNITMNRQQRVVYQALLSGPKTTVDLRDKYNVMSPAPRVMELKRKGFDIVALSVDVIDGDGFVHKDVANYVLRSTQPATQESEVK